MTTLGGRSAILAEAVAKRGGYGAPARPEARTTFPGEDDPLVDWSGEGTEMLGGLLWAAFARGCDPCRSGIDVIEKGRELSRCWVRHNDGNPGERSPPTQTLDCASACGKEAKRLAASRNSITGQHVPEARSAVRKDRAKALARLPRTSAAPGEEEYEIRAGGCG